DGIRDFHVTGVQTCALPIYDVWRKIIKSQVLSLKLAGKKPEDIQKTVAGRYERLAKSMSQFNSEDIFSMYMNTITSAYDPHTNRSEERRVGKECRARRTT